MREEAASSAARAALTPGSRAAAAARAEVRKARRGASETCVCFVWGEARV